VKSCGKITKLIQQTAQISTTFQTCAKLRLIGFGQKCKQAVSKIKNLLMGRVWLITASTPHRGIGLDYDHIDPQKRGRVSNYILGGWCLIWSQTYKPSHGLGHVLILLKQRLTISIY